MAEKIQFFSDSTQRLYQLYPTKTIPTLKISGVPMHRFATIDPKTDTERKIQATRPRGRVLDCCMGLGYTAIFSARLPQVTSVQTFEKDENVLNIAKMNSASNELFTNQKITVTNKDSGIAVKDLKNKSFDTIIHDPPTFRMAPELYTEGFYKELKRILRPAGTLWHYCPNPGKMKGKDSNFRESIKKKLSKAGFKNIIYDENSLGFVCKI